MVSRSTSKHLRHLRHAPRSTRQLAQVISPSTLDTRLRSAEALSLGSVVIYSPHSVSAVKSRTDILSVGGGNVKDLARRPATGQYVWGSGVTFIWCWGVPGIMSVGGKITWRHRNSRSSCSYSKSHRFFFCYSSSAFHLQPQVPNLLFLPSYTSSH